MWKTAFAVSLAALSVPSILGFRANDAPLFLYYILTPAFAAVFGAGVADLLLGAGKWRDRGLIVGTIACVIAIILLEAVGLLGWAAGQLSQSISRYQDQVANLSSQATPPNYASVILRAILFELVLGMATAVVLLPVAVLNRPRTTKNSL